MAKRYCEFPGCGEVHLALGLCRRHYEQHRKGTNLTLRKPPPVGCAYPNCDRRHGVRGLCLAHHKQRLRGVPLGPIRQLKWGAVRSYVDAALAAWPRIETCWTVWPFHAAKDGRPEMTDPRKGRGHTRVARYVVFQETGEWPAMACHHCDNPACWNPRHLYAGDNRTNVVDRSVRGRWKGGRKPVRVGCNEPGCSGKHFSLGLCRPHYMKDYHLKRRQAS